MDPAALQTSWARFEELGDEAASLFYAILFTLAPEMRTLFPISMTTQRDKFLSAMGHMIKNLANGEDLLQFSAQLGRDHRRFDVRPEHYPLVGRAFLATLERALGPNWTSQLAADWAEAYDAVAQLMMDAARKSEAVAPPWWDATVVRVEPRCAETTVLTVQPFQHYPYVPGQSMAVETTLRPKAWRYLSPANRPRPDNTLEFHIRAVQGGQVSPALAYRLRPGDTLRLGAPVGTALIEYLTSSNDMLLIAGGTGLAPMRAIVEQVAHEGRHRLATLVVGARTAADLYDREALDRLAARLPWLTVVQAVSEDPFWTGRRGTAVDVALRLDDWSRRDIYLCGSAELVVASSAQLVAAGYLPSQIHAEDFRNDAYLPPMPARAPSDERVGR